MKATDTFGNYKERDFNVYIDTKAPQLIGANGYRVTGENNYFTFQLDELLKGYDGVNLTEGFVNKNYGGINGSIKIEMQNNETIVCDLSDPTKYEITLDDVNNIRYKLILVGGQQVQIGGATITVNVQDAYGNIAESFKVTQVTNVN